MTLRTRHALVLLALGAVTFGACSSDTKTIETKDGKVTVDGDGKHATVTINGDQGGSVTFNQSKVPSDFPSEVPLPKGLNLKTSASGNAPVGTGQFFSLGYDLANQNTAQVLSAYTSTLEDDGFTVKDSSSVGGSTGSISSLQATGKGWNVTAAAIASDKTAILTISVVTSLDASPAGA